MRFIGAGEVCRAGGWHIATESFPELAFCRDYEAQDPYHCLNCPMAVPLNSVALIVRFPILSPAVQIGGRKATNPT